MQIGTQAQAELLDEGLGRAIDVTAGIRPVSRDRTDVDHMANVAFDHVRQQGAGHVHQAFGVGVDHGFPVVGVGLVRRLQTQRQPGIIDQYINVAQRCRQLINHLLNGRAITHVEADDMQCFTQLVFQLFQTFDTTARGNHLMAFADKTPCNGLTKSGCGTRNKNDHVAVPQLFLT
ncbi:hypothetical protein D3C80_1501970 [compost metagenome]